LARMVHAEIKLRKRVDWTTIEELSHMEVPTTPDIPRGVLTFPDGGLGKIMKKPKNAKKPDYTTATSEEDSDSDGGRKTVAGPHSNAVGSSTTTSVAINQVRKSTKKAKANAKTTKHTCKIRGGGIG